jgi:sulfite reductase (NADPH) hemoprotein beta-component
MYHYDEFDQAFVLQRTEEFRLQVQRRLNNEISEEDFKLLRLMNGVYLQLHAYMLRVAIPYGQLNSKQMRVFANLADIYDRGYGHFTTRQNIQYNWPELDRIPDMLAELAQVELHAIQTSGNCIRNVTSDPFAGVSADEMVDPRVYAELLRQWSSLHPEFSFLPRKFKIAITGAKEDRAAVKVHDIGLYLSTDENQQVKVAVWVGGGQGRTPRVAQLIKEDLPAYQLCSYLESIMRSYNLYGRRDQKYKARIKILVDELGIDRLRELVEKDFNQRNLELDAFCEKEIKRIQKAFTYPRYEENLSYPNPDLLIQQAKNPEFKAWCDQNLFSHRVVGYKIVQVSLKPIGGVPGDINSQQMRKLADLADQFSQSELRATHDQNLVLPNVKEADLYALWLGLSQVGLATANAGLISDAIACPGLDYCTLANARSIPIAQRIAQIYSEISKQQEIGELRVKISGCINACGHHHVGHIGILGIDRKNEEYYQISLGGNAQADCQIGEIIGRALSADELVLAVQRMIDHYLQIRLPGERLIDVYHRLGIRPFQEVVYHDMH